MEWSQSKIIRIESGSVSISVTDLRALLALYHVADQQRVDELLALARAARRRTWLAPYRDLLSPAFATYVELEADTSVMRHFHATLVPGILQTPEYASACIVESMSAIDRQAGSSLFLEIRLRRQREVFDQDSPPDLVLVLDEAVLRREIGGRSVMAAQLKHLIDLATRPHVEILVIPFSSGAHAGVFGPFVIMDFADPEDKPVLYREGAFMDELVRDRSDLIGTYRETFDHLVATALDEAESLAFIRRVAEETS
jgi:hypothetical protein